MDAIKQLNKKLKNGKCNLKDNPDDEFACDGCVKSGTSLCPERVNDYDGWSFE